MDGCLNLDGGPKSRWGTLTIDGGTRPPYNLNTAFTYIRQEDVAKIPKMPRAPRNVNPARKITQL